MFLIICSLDLAVRTFSEYPHGSLYQAWGFGEKGVVWVPVEKGEGGGLLSGGMGPGGGGEAEGVGYD